MSTTLPIVEELVFLPKWGCTLTILFTPDGPYCVLRQLCQVIGVEDARQQYEQLSKRQATREYVTKLPVQTARRGKQVTYCIYLDVLAWWLAGLNDRLIRAEFAPQLVRFQKDVIRAATAVLFGDADKQDTQMDQTKGKIIRLQDRLGASSQPLDSMLANDLGVDDRA
jgi:hypothetical protein